MGIACFHKQVGKTISHTKYPFYKTAALPQRVISEESLGTVEASINLIELSRS